MSKPTLPQRVLERMDKLEDRLERLCTAIEQNNALIARGSFQVVGTTGPTGQVARGEVISGVPVGGTGVPKYYGQPNAETKRDQTKRGGKVRRPRQASRG